MIRYLKCVAYEFETNFYFWKKVFSDSHNSLASFLGTDSEIFWELLTTNGARQLNVEKFMELWR